MAKAQRTVAANERLREKFLEMAADGADVASIVMCLGRSDGWYRIQRRENPDWARQVDEVRFGPRPQASVEGGDGNGGRPVLPPFPEFCEKYLGIRLFEHQLQWWDLLEGRPPRNLHPSMVYEPGNPNYIMINCPPEHSKSTVISVLWVLYKLIENPDQQVVLVSKTETFAKKLIYQIKGFMTHPKHRKMQEAFGPAGGWKDTADAWSTSMVYLNAKDRSTRNKDPNLQAKGLAQQIYGDRCTIAVVDDAAVLNNAHLFESQAEWIQQELLTRLGPGGKLVIVGTRVAPVDIYRHLRDPEIYPTGVSPWTYFSQPAVLNFADKPEDWQTLWPRSDVPLPGTTDQADEDGLYPRWNGKNIAVRRGMVSSRVWAQAYMQQSVSADMPFPAELVQKACNGMRSPGLMHAGAAGYRPRGMEGLYVVVGVDPAMTGDTAMTVIGVDRFNGKRYILDCRLKTAASPTWIRDTIKELVDLFKPAEVRVETNAFQLFLSRDPELLEYCGNRGVVLQGHFTGKNKIDPVFGVASMAAMFHANLVEFPAPRKSEAVRQLVDQLITWLPDTKGKTDLVMSMWFAELKCREIVATSQPGKTRQFFANNPFRSRQEKSMRTVINLADIVGLEHKHAGQ